MVESFPDTRNRSDRNAGSAGDVPVLMLNTTLIKDDVMGKVWRTEDGPAGSIFRTGYRRASRRADRGDAR